MKCNKTKHTWLDSVPHQIDYLYIVVQRPIVNSLVFGFNISHVDLRTSHDNPDQCAIISAGSLDRLVQTLCQESGWALDALDNGQQTFQNRTVHFTLQRLFDRLSGQVLISLED